MRNSVLRDFNWDDLRFFLALARQGTYSKAAAQLGVNHTTVGRRIQHLQDELGVLLFERSPDGFALTQAGEDLNRAAERIEEEMIAATRIVTGHDSSLSGTIRVTMVAGMAIELMPDIARFKGRYPEIDLEITTSIRISNITRREADVAVRMVNQPPEHLVGRKAVTVEYAVYGSKDLTEGHTPERPLNAYPWVVWDPALEPRLTREWRLQNAPGATIGCACDSVEAAMAAMENSLGVMCFPCWLGDKSPHLERLTPPIEGFGHDLWVLTHPDLRHTARIKAFVKHIMDALQRRAPLFASY